MNMARCAKCRGNNVEVLSGPTRRSFLIHCLRRGCGATTVKDLGIGAAMTGALSEPRHSHTSRKNGGAPPDFNDANDG